MNISNLKEKKMKIMNYELKKTKNGYRYSGYLNLRGCTGLIDYPVIHSCGNEKRTIYIKKKNPKLIHIGCFVGTQKEAINAVKLKYGHDSNGYVTKIKKCFKISESKWGGK